MKSNKIITLLAVTLLSFNLSACNKQNTNEKSNTTLEQESSTKVTKNDNNYASEYKSLYEKYIYNLKNLSKYSNIDNIKKSFEKSSYPGNEEYLKNIKEAYNKSADAISSFISELKSNTTIDNSNLEKMNNELLIEGNLEVSNIEEMIKRIDQIPQDVVDNTKSKEEFINIVAKTSTLQSNSSSEFNEMIKYMNEKLNIEKK